MIFSPERTVPPEIPVHSNETVSSAIHPSGSPVEFHPTALLEAFVGSMMPSRDEALRGEALRKALRKGEKLDER